VNDGNRSSSRDNDARLQRGQFLRQPRQPIEDTFGKAQCERVIDTLGETCLLHALADRVNPVPRLVGWVG